MPLKSFDNTFWNVQQKNFRISSRECRFRAPHGVDDEARVAGVPFREWRPLNGPPTGITPVGGRQERFLAERALEFVPS
jgi:hypothetical protein